MSSIFHNLVPLKYNWAKKRSPFSSFTMVHYCSSSPFLCLKPRLKLVTERGMEKRELVGKTVKKESVNGEASTGREMAEGKEGV